MSEKKRRWEKGGSADAGVSVFFDVWPFLGVVLVDYTCFGKEEETGRGGKCGRGRFIFWVYDPVSV